MSFGSAEQNNDPLLNSSSSSSSKRRSSSRFIKRRKFDDELVESSLNTPVSSVISRPGRMRTQSANSSSADGGTPTPNETVTFEPFPPVDNTVRGRRTSGKTAAQVATPSAVATTSNSTNRKRKVNKHNLSSTYKDLGRWKPVDDLLLVQAVLQTSDLRAVYQGVKFSCKFTFNEIAQRWYALIYDKTISKLALSAIRNLQAETIAHVEANCLYSEPEEEVLASVKSTVDPKLSVFEELLEKNRHIFHRARAAKSLYAHWCMMKQHNLLSDQSEKPISIPTLTVTEERNNALLNSFGNVQETPLQRSENIPTFPECEEFLNDSELLGDVKDAALDKQLALMDRISKKDIRMLEDELCQIQIASAAIPGANSVEFDNETLAVLRGRCVRYLMRSKEITLGRKTQDNQVDVDLSLEGPAWKISRRQATIRVKNNGEFFISSEGKRPIYVDGNPVLMGNKRILNNNSVLEIAGLRFIFLINYEFLNIVIRHETAKMSSHNG